jgi:predicted NACHT family NTPase
MICPKCGQDGVAEGSNLCPNCGSGLPKEAAPTTQIAVTQEVKNAQGKVTAVEIGEVKGDIRIEFRDKEEERDRLNKLILLKKVKDFWIKGVLERSLHGAFLIEIGKEEEMGAVERPWSKLLYIPDQPNLIIPPNKKILEIFDESSQSLLILGEPGSGKTTEMLELAKEAISVAEKDPIQPIPVVFNLSSWADPKQTIVDWLVQYLNENYQVSKEMGRNWIENRDLMLLLDGLDEVKPENRVSCVEAINKLIQDGSYQIVVCSRIQEYQALKILLKLNKAILLQPLSTEQVEGFLDAVGSKLSSLKEALKKDSALWELVKTPLMLSIIGFVYADLPIDDIMQPNADSEIRRKTLYEAYVNKMFAREGKSKSDEYTREQTIEWLSWLAGRMTDHGQTVFLLDRMQPTWLKTKNQITMFNLIFYTSLDLLMIVSLGLIGLMSAIAGGVDFRAILGSWLIILFELFLFFLIPFVLFSLIDENLKKWKIKTR